MSDGNRELVIDFISHKLGQKGYSFSLCCASGHENGTQLPESGEGDGRPNGSPSWESAAAQVMTDVSFPSTSTNDAVKMALRDAGDEFELRYCRAFSDLTSQLHITPDTAYQSFEQVVNELFRDGVNWGRIVAFFSFGGALSVESVDKEMEGLVANIVSWMSTYLSRNLDPWIQENGGWDTFAKMYGNDAAADARRSQERFGKWLLTGFTLAGALLLGSYLSRR